MRRLIACLMLAAAASMGAATAADDPQPLPVPPAEPAPTPLPVPPAEPPPTLPPETTVVATRAEETEEDTRAVRFFAEATAWLTQPVGGDYGYATAIDTGSPLNTTTLTQSFGTSDRARWRLGAILKGDIGGFFLTYWAASVDEPASALHPGRFVIGETLVYPLYAGLNNDGRADGVEFVSGTGTRDTRFDFIRDAFKTGRMSAKWLAGLRFVDHSQSAAATYHALVPNLPPLIDESGMVATLLIPRADSASRKSGFSGRGIEAGFEARYQVLPKFHLDGSIVYALLRGKTDASYASTTHVYVAQRSEEEGPVFLAPSDYDCVFSNPSGARCDIFEPLAGEDPNDPLYHDYQGYSQLSQQDIVLGLRDGGSSSSASVLEANLGFRWRAWRTLEVLGGIRQTRYDDAILELRPRDPTFSLDGTLNFQSIEREYRSIAYEGYYVGVAFTF